MNFVKRFSAAMALIMSMYILMSSPLYAYLERMREAGIESGRMKNVSVYMPQSRGGEQAETAPSPTQELPQHVVSTMRGEETVSDGAAYAETIPAIAITQTLQSGKEVVETTIEGGLAIKNQTGYKADVGQLLVNGPGLVLPEGAPQILIIHTHSSEAYMPAGLDKYDPTDESRTEDTQYNIVRVGDELTAVLEQAGLNVIHDRGLYDYPSYTGSYTRSGQAIADWLAEYPSIKMVLDVHRDALGENGIVYKTMAEEEGVCASQVMLLVGTDESGLAHSGWRGNLALAVYLQQAVSTAHPTLMRPVLLVPQRYNQHLTPGSMIIEVGSSGNTLQEALAAVRLFGESAGAALAGLVAPAGETALE